MKNLMTICVVAVSILAINNMSIATVVDTFDTISSDWTVDRTAPETWESAYFDGDNRLKHGVGPSSVANTWYAYKGKSLLTPGATGVSVELYVPEPTVSQDVSLSLWANGTDGTLDQLAWPVIGFRASSDGSAVWKVFDDETGNWNTLSDAAAFDTWYTLGISLNGGNIDFSINGETVFTDTVVDSSVTSFKNVILQAYDFGTEGGYYAYWDNLSTVPEPATLALLGLGGLLLRKRRA